MVKAIFRPPAQSGNAQMSLAIVFALLVTLTKSLLPPLTTEVGFGVAAAVVMAGLLGYICRPERTTGESLESSRRFASVTEGHFETADRLRQGVATRPPRSPIAESSLVRRLVLAKDDPAKQRIRALLSNVEDQQLFRMGLTSEDIAALRGTASPPAEATIAQAPDAASEDSVGSHVSPPIAGLLDAADDTPRRERVSRILSC
jgi:hypothetical protein